MSETKQLLINIEIEDYNNPANYPNQYFTELSKVDSIQTVIILNNQFIFYFIIKSDIFNKLKKNSTFFFNNKYLVNIFYGIIPDTRAAEISITEKL